VDQVVARLTGRAAPNIDHLAESARPGVGHMLAY